MLSHLPLQWRRGRTTAEIRCAYIEQRPPARLQWGRGHTTAEMTKAVENDALIIETLQWGRGRTTAEMVTLEATDCQRLGGDVSSAVQHTRRWASGETEWVGQIPY